MIKNQVIKREKWYGTHPFSDLEYLFIRILKKVSSNFFI